MSFAPFTHTQLIGFGHKARQGKGLAANYAIDLLGSRGRVFGFADALKAHCRVSLGMRGKDGPLLQRVGTELRAADSDVFERTLHAAIKEWDDDAHEPQFALIADMRFPAEADFVKQLGGINVRVTRYGENGTPYVDPSRDPLHPSEIALTDYPFDYAIDCTEGDLSFLRRSTNYIVTKMLGDVSPFGQTETPQAFCRLLAASLDRIEILGQEGKDEPEGVRFGVLSETLLHDIREGARANANA